MEISVSPKLKVCLSALSFVVYLAFLTLTKTKYGSVFFAVPITVLNALFFGVMGGSISGFLTLIINISFILTMRGPLTLNQTLFHLTTTSSNALIGVLVGYISDLKRKNANFNKILIQAESEKKACEDIRDVILKNIRDVIFCYDPIKDALLYISDSFESVFERSKSEVLQNPRKAFIDCIYEEDRKKVINDFEISMKKMISTNSKYRIITQGNKTKCLSTFITPLKIVKPGGEKATVTVGIARDITKLGKHIFKLRGLVEKNKQLNRQLRLLMKENNHRIKNNLNILLSLFSFEGDSSDRRINQLIDDLSGKIYAISLLHEKLGYFDDQLMKGVDLIPYLREIVNVYIHNLFHKENENVYLDFKANTDIRLDSRAATRIGIILVELISNTNKYAFYEIDTTKVIRISIQYDFQKTQLTIIFRDNGKNYDFEKSWNNPSFGLELIREMLRDLEGALEYHYNKGSIYTITLQVEPFHEKVLNN